MNIKSLLLGSAAALVAVSGARAADAVVVAEPEPMEYVRICDTYGAGFYYIPGTETCLRISGLIRYDIDYNDKPDVVTTITTPAVTAPVFGGPDLTVPVDSDADGVQDVALVTPGSTRTVTLTPGLDDGWAKTATARVNIDARSETELGTLRRFMRLQGSVKSGEDQQDVEVIYAYVEVFGFLVGLYDTLYDGDISPEFDSGGGSSAHQIRYTWTGGNGITVQASLETQTYNVEYTPNIGGRIAIAQGWGGLQGFVMYDAITEEVGVKGIATFNANDMFMLEALATYESGAGDFSVSSGVHTGYEWSLAGAVSAKVSDKITLRAGGQYFGQSFATDSDDYTVGGQVDFTPVENLLLRGQVAYNGGDDQDFTSAKFRLESAF